jgi:hypothetical protein
MDERNDERGGPTKEPMRLFSSDPELARIRTLLDRDGPPEGAAERALARMGGVRSPEGWAQPSLMRKLLLVTGFGLFVAASLHAANMEQRPVVSSEPTSTGRVLGPSAGMANARVVDGIPNARVVDGIPNAEGAPDTESAPIQTVRIEDLPPAAARVPSPGPSAADPFLLELSLVEQARAALANQRGRECLDVVARYTKRFSNTGHFLEEVEVMRIEALAISDDRAEARARAVRFLKEHKGTPYAERLRRVLQESGGEQ